MISSVLLVFAVGGCGATAYVGYFYYVLVAIHIKEDTPVAKPAAVGGAFIGERNNIASEGVMRHFFKDAE